MIIIKPQTTSVLTQMKSKLRTNPWGNPGEGPRLFLKQHLLAAEFQTQSSGHFWTCKAKAEK